ncbi:MAG: selenide, water dikinase SelD [Bernardetiaceae bacterium]|jgi:selenide,water dikinase|nr:selenide, water dikinase SelD [Bernardetiaceae bacterium]
MSSSPVYKLTQYSHGAGCGCKIAPQVLDAILHTAAPAPVFPRLLVGNDTRDDAAVYELPEGPLLISTTDFFMPIVDDAFDFGRIASANALSDVYAMGGTPLLAIAILGWPLAKLPAEVARQVLEGSRAVCAEAGIPLAGGHSIDCPEPVFGLAVTGTVAKAHLKRNSTAQPGDLLYLTKPLGVGILTTAEKKGLLAPAHAHLAREQMTRLNQLGTALGRLPQVHALTDVTGFGLLGHLTEMCQGSGLAATLYAGQVPQLPHLADYLAQNAVPGGTHRNWDSYGHGVQLPDPALRYLLADPQTSGGLLIAAAPDTEGLAALLAQHGAPLQPIGQLHRPTGGPLINVLA